MTPSAQPSASASSTFPTTSGRTRGYNPAHVDAFLERARAAFEADAGSETMSASDIRQVSFPMTRRGYQPASVDAALSRVEDAFAARERHGALARAGSGAWIQATRTRAQEILDRLSRPSGHRFARAGLLRYGYRVDEVDAAADRIAAFLARGEPVSVEQVRSVAFRMQRRGYDEAQVDAVLDAVVEILLAVG